MYAIIRTGGKQYKVQAGDVVQVDKVAQDLGAEFVINEVLLVGGETATLGSPLVKGASVTVVVTKQAKTRKQIVFKKKRRQGYRKFATHKQEFSELFIKAISFDGKTAKAEGSANVVDVKAVRAEKAQARVADRKERAENKSKGTAEVVKKAAKKVAKKKVAKKAVKKTAKKATKTGAKKKAAKKTSKKA
ncbi:50S ribosomal protein L21 [Bdellovibrio bacteriovorus]|uniref:Large ribosomal subunit protein bL21 n=1 Tax=Bdellovibrio bacteriovorus TaxID=959 RepID=A0A150WQ79_BDEBC|nr:50S ribosomal protein L21 [Bdellovibrio bacteriovorus]KYG66651.1 50S ribosomal protein L21 [Bdellovibrio bacteriovorus]